jgi:hypothetical protein
LPNKAYNAATAEMVDYGNKPAPDGIGFSALDLARMLSWLDLLGCHYPKYANMAKKVAARWNFDAIIRDGQMYGGSWDAVGKKEVPVQEGRAGYEQYAGKMFAKLGFDVHVSASYENEFVSRVDVLGVSMPFDLRDPRKLGAFNYVVTESYGLDAMEFGRDGANTALIDAIYEVQKRRWQKTGVVTAVSEDNIDRPPYFVYNTIFAAGSAWNTITDTGDDQSKLRSVSTKAAFSLAAIKPDDPYSAVLMDAVRSAYDPEKGWYSGVYEDGLGYNKAITANTNGIILEVLMYKSMGALHQACSRCGRSVRVVEPPQPVCTLGCQNSERR